MQCCIKNFLEHDRKFKNYIINTSEYFQNLESKEFIKINLTDILLHGEKTNEYVQKHYKQNNKKKNQRGI